MGGEDGFVGDRGDNGCEAGKTGESGGVETGPKWYVSPLMTKSYDSSTGCGFAFGVVFSGRDAGVGG